MAFWKSRKGLYISNYLIHRKNTDCAAWSCLKIQQPRYWMLFICIVNILLITKGNSRHVCSRGPLQRGHPKYTKNIIQQTSQNLRKKSWKEKCLRISISSYNTNKYFLKQTLYRLLIGPLYTTKTSYWFILSET